MNDYPPDHDIEINPFILEEMMVYLGKARYKHPVHARSMLESVALVCEESGEALREVLTIRQEGLTMEGVSKALDEMYQTVAVGIRSIGYLEGVISEIEMVGDK